MKINKLKRWALARNKTVNQISTLFAFHPNAIEYLEDADLVILTRKHLSYLFGTTGFPQSRDYIKSLRDIKVEK